MPPAVESARQAEVAAEGATAAAGAEPAASAATHDPYVASDHTIHAPVPTVEAVSVPRSEAAVKETKRDWM